MPASPRCAGEHGLELLVARQARPHAVDQVRPIEAADQHERVAQPELADDVLAHAGRRGRRERVHRHLRPGRAQRAELPVLRPEVVAPVADAVRFVDGDVAHAGPRHRRLEAGAAVAHQAFGRHVEQLEAPVAQAVEGRLPRVRGHRAVEARRRHAARDQAVDLVLHQRDEGRDDERDAGVVADQGRHLEAQRLAAAGRQHHDAVAAFQHGVDRRALQGPQRLEPPVALEDVVDGRRQRLDGGSYCVHAMPTSPRPRRASSCRSSRPAPRSIRRAARAGGR